MVPGVKLVVLGKQGAGKGTQAVALSHHYVVPHIATGDMLRSRASRSGSDLGQQGQGHHGPRRAAVRRDDHRDGRRAADRGRCAGRVASSWTAARGPCTRRRCSPSYSMSDELDAASGHRGPDLRGARAPRPAAGLLGLRDQLLDHRSPPRINWTCDICFGEVVQREDDTEEAIRVRLELYERETEPLIAWYQEQGSSSPSTGWATPDTSAAADHRCRGGPPDGGVGEDDPDETLGRRDREDAQGGQGRRRDARGHPGRARRPGSPPFSSTRSPARSSTGGVPGPTSSTTGASRRPSARRPTT